MTKKVIITGGTGFIGANLVRRLLSDGHELHLLARPNFSGWRIDDILPEVNIHHCEFTDRKNLGRIIKRINPQWIFHLAVHGAYSFQQDLNEMVKTNIIGTINLVEACLQTDFEAFVNTGSSAEYGFKNHPPKEDEYIEPNSYYAVTKASATHYCRYTAIKTGRKIPTLRLYSVYGPYEEPSRLLPTLIVKGLKGELPPLVSPQIARDFVYVEDIVDAYLNAVSCEMKEYGAVYNVGGGAQTTLKKLVDLAREVLNIEENPNWGSMEERSWDTNVWVCDNTKIKQELGWQTKYSLEEGFKAMIEWFVSNPRMLEYYNKGFRV